MGLGLTYIYALVLTQFSLPIYGLKMIALQTYKEDFGVETIFKIWWHGNVIELLCRFLFSINTVFSKSSWFNFI